MNRESLYKSALIGGIALGILSALPVISAFNCLCCAWVIAGGVVAANLYVKDSPTAVTLGGGVIVGLLTGAIGAVVDTLFTIPVQMALHGIGMGVGEQLRQFAEVLPNLPPEARDLLRSLSEQGAGIGGFVFFVGALLKLVIYSLVGMLGGALGVAIFEKRSPEPTRPAGTQLYQPPPPGPPPPPPDIPGPS